MEELPNLENRENFIGRKIEELAREEGMEPNDILSDIVTFAEISESDPDASAYLEELVEKFGIEVGQIGDVVAYARKIVENSDE